jgi:hypothetical protein|nr:MAG TPA: hypothetical protein [Caudoviricetes sp.]
MLNRNGISKTTYGAPRQILANVDIQASVGCRVPQSIGVDLADGRKIAKAGTPIIVNFGNLQADVAATVGPTAGVFTLQITTAFAADEVLTIAGVNYTCAAAEDVNGKKFAGADAAAQVTSLLKMVKTDKYEVAAVSGATDKIGFTQKVADVTDTAGPEVSKTSSTGAIGSVTKVTDPSAGTTGNAVLLHDVDVTAGKANGTALYIGVVNTNRLEADVKAKVAYGVNVVGGVSFVNA